MAVLKRSLVALLVGAALGFVLWSIFGKSATSMMFTSLGGTFSCQTDVELALDKFVSMQLYSALGGGVLAVVGNLLFKRWANKRVSAQTTPEIP